MVVVVQVERACLAVNADTGAWPPCSAARHSQLFALTGDEAPLLAEDDALVLLRYRVRLYLGACRVFVPCEVLLVLLLEAVRRVSNRLP